MILERPLELLRERRRRLRPPAQATEHLQAAVRWLFAAQDATPDRGVSHSYLVGKRWMRSYPETTGYIIPTLLNWSQLAQDAQAGRRALEMADWEIEVQLDNGAIPDLRDGQPVIFDTGQVLFGWVAAYQHTGEQRYLDAAQRGARWLLSALDRDGVWRAASDAGGPGRVYNARVAWALMEYARHTGDQKTEEPMRRFLDWTLQREACPGWFEQNCLTQDQAPLLHTIAYTARGQLESGLLLDESRYLEAARRTALAVAAHVGPDGRLAGRFDRDWNRAVSWSCLTGMAQISIVWRRLCSLDGVLDSTEAARLTEASDQVNGFLMRVHDRTARHEGLRGGVRGSYPVNGAYGQWRVLNWATKFFIDALMAQMPGDRLVYRG